MSDLSQSALGVRRSLLTSRVERWAALVFLGALPALTVVVLFTSTIAADSVALDFRQFYVAAQAIVDGESPYSERESALWGGPYPYPPLPALLATPLVMLPFQAAGLIVMATLVLVALACLFVVDVRDWRCYGLVLLWPPVISAIQTGNVTLWLALALALTWRFRDRLLAPAASLGASLAVKLFLWPVVIWMAATRRYTAAVLACVAGVFLLLVSWAAIGFAGFRSYPDLLQRLEDAVGADSYTAYIVGLDLGLPSTAARGLWLALGFGLLAFVVVLGRRGDERSAFVLAIAAALALTPIVWLHYFALLVVVVAVARPRLGIVWFVPLGMALTPGSGHPTPFETSWTLAVAVAAFGLAVREARRAGVSEPASRVAEVT